MHSCMLCFLPESSIKSLFVQPFWTKRFSDPTQARTKATNQISQTDQTRSGNHALAGAGVTVEVDGPVFLLNRPLPFLRALRLSMRDRWTPPSSSEDETEETEPDRPALRPGRRVVRPGPKLEGVEPMKPELVVVVFRLVKLLLLWVLPVIPAPWVELCPAWSKWSSPVKPSRSSGPAKPWLRPKRGSLTF